MQVNNYKTEKSSCHENIFSTKIPLVFTKRKFKPGSQNLFNVLNSFYVFQ